MKVTAMWDTTPCSLVEVDRLFVRAYYRHHEGDKKLAALMTEAVSTTETSVNFYEATRRNIPEGCHLQKKKTTKI
jgi:hypothetical protein